VAVQNTIKGREVVGLFWGRQNWFQSGHDPAVAFGADLGFSERLAVLTLVEPI